MCGGYTRVCVKCGMCGKVDQRPLLARGTCARCGYENEPDALRCVECGAPIPKPPGSPTVRDGGPGVGSQSKKDSSND